MRSTQDIAAEIERLKTLAPFAELREAAQKAQEYATALMRVAADIEERIANKQPMLEQATSVYDRNRQLFTVAELSNLITETHDTTWRRFGNAITAAMQSPLVDQIPPPPPVNLPEKAEG